MALGLHLASQCIDLLLLFLHTLQGLCCACATTREVSELLGQNLCITHTHTHTLSHTHLGMHSARSAVKVNTPMQQ